MKINFSIARVILSTLWVGMLSLCALSKVLAAVYIDDARLVAKSPQYAQVAPTPRLFTVTAGGRYSVTLVDVGYPSPLTSVDLVVTKGSRTIIRVLQAGTQEFDATPGVYTVHVLGQGPSAGSVGVVVKSVTGGDPLLEYQTGIVGNPPSAVRNQSSYSEQVTVTTAGSYEVSLVDRQFPATLTSFNMLVLSASGTPVARICQPTTSMCSQAPVTFNAQPGQYDVFVDAVAADPAQAGLFSIKIVGGPASAAIYSVTHPVGTLQGHTQLQFPAAAQYSLTLNDLQFPVSLTNLSAVIAQGGDLLVNLSGVATQSFNADMGAATLYTWATPATVQGVGALGVLVLNGSQTLYGDAKAIVGATANGARAYAILGSFPGAGQYRFRSNDFSFPATIPALQLLVTQDGASLGSATSNGPVLVQGKAGQFMIVAIANMLSPTATGLFGITVDAQPSGAEVLTIAQGVGDVFNSRTVNAPKVGSLDVTLGDLGFPEQFLDLALIVTRGNSMVGQIFGGGKFSFPATTGDYTLNFVARNSAAENYGLYGIKVEDSPPVPTVTLTANPTSILTQGSTAVTWSTTDADSCTASGGWSGVRATSGSNVSVGPIASDTTLTLTCTGPGGTKSAEVKIVLATATPSDTGGGSIALWQLFAYSMLGIHVLMRRKI